MEHERTRNNDNMLREASAPWRSRGNSGEEAFLEEKHDGGGFVPTDHGLCARVALTIAQPCASDRPSCGSLYTDTIVCLCAGEIFAAVVASCFQLRADNPMDVQLKAESYLDDDKFSSARLARDGRHWMPGGLWVACRGC